MLPKTSVEFQEAPLPQAPVAAVFALITLATTLTANGVPVPQAVLTGDLSLLSDPQYISVAVPGTVATFALLRALPSSLHTRFCDQPARRCPADVSTVIYRCM